MSDSSSSRRPPPSWALGSCHFLQAAELRLHSLLLQGSPYSSPSLLLWESRAAKELFCTAELVYWAWLVLPFLSRINLELIGTWIDT